MHILGVLLPENQLVKVSHMSLVHDEGCDINE